MRPATRPNSPKQATQKRLIDIPRARPLPLTAPWSQVVERYTEYDAELGRQETDEQRTRRLQAESSLLSIHHLMMGHRLAVLRGDYDEATRYAELLFLRMPEFYGTTLRLARERLERLHGA